MFLRHVKPIITDTASSLENYFKVPIRRFTPRRALLYVPAHDTKKVSKALSLDVDCITLDCEDGVALTKKVQARLNIRELLDKGKPEKKRKYDLAVRVNSVNSTILEDDLSVILTGKNLPDTVYLPKVHSSDHLKLFAENLEKYIKTNVKIGLIIAIESAIGLINCSHIAATAKKLSETSKFIPVALLFGSDDFCANIGCRKSESGYEFMYARQKIVASAKAFGLQAIDLVYINYKDMEGFNKQVQEGAHLGFTGKQVIHPNQIEPAQNGFVPSKEVIEWARAVIKEYYKHQDGGEGVFTFRDQMIDMPTIKQAQNVVDLVNAIMMHN